MELVNRRRSKEGAKGSVPNLPMRQVYTEVRSTLPTMLEYSQALRGREQRKDKYFDPGKVFLLYYCPWTWRALNFQSLPQCHDAQTTTQGTGSTGALGSLARSQQSCVSGRRMYCLRPDGSVHDGSHAAPVLGTRLWQSKHGDCNCMEGRSSWGAGDIKGSESLRLWFAPCPLLKLSFQ